MIPRLRLDREQAWVLAAGLLLGAAGSLLVVLGNPANTGLCISCFLESAAGALGLHDNARMQYLRPELMGFFLGSFAMAAFRREYRPRAGGAAMTGLGLGFLMILGCVVFVGCPIKAMLRLAAGDLNALVGMAGLAAGVWAGLKALRACDLGLEAPLRPASAAVGLGIPAGALLLTALLFVPGALKAGRGGASALHAPLLISLGAGLLLGIVCQRSRFCVTGSVRDLLLTRRLSTGLGLLAAFGVAVALDLATGQFHLGYADQPGAHLEWGWSFAGMALTGWAAVLAGGCPFRQIVKAGEGDLDASAIVLGMLLAAVAAQAWGLSATSAGVPPQGKAAVLAGFAALLALSVPRGRPA